MPAPTVTVLEPPPLTYSTTIPRPGTRVSWTGGVGPFNVLHEWDTDPAFGTPLQDLNAGASSPDVGAPPADLGPAGTAWYYRATVTDTSDSAFTTTPSKTLTFVDPVAHRRYLHLLANVGVGFTPTDDPAGGWGEANGGTVGPDGDTISFRRYLHLLANVGVGFTPTDDPAGGWGEANGGTVGPDGDTTAFRRYLHLLANVGVGFDPIDTPPGGWGPAPGSAPGDGYAISFRRYLHLLAGDVSDTTPTPHIWHLYPSFGEEGWEFVIVGMGFGDSQAEYSGSVTLSGVAAGVVAWALIPDSGADPKVIDPATNTATPEHQEVRVVVPTGAASGPVIVCTDAP